MRFHFPKKLSDIHNSFGKWYVLKAAVLVAAASCYSGDPEEKTSAVKTEGSLDREAVEATALIDRTFVRPGETFRIAVVMNIAETWHTYANPKGPGAGVPTNVHAVPREGFTFSEARYVPGEKLVSEYDAEDWVHAYKGKVPVFIEATADAALDPGRYSITLNFFALGCNGMCVAFEKDLALAVTVEAPGAGPAEKRHAGIFSAFDTARPPTQTPAPQRTGNT